MEAVKEKKVFAADAVSLRRLNTTVAADDLIGEKDKMLKAKLSEENISCGIAELTVQAKAGKDISVEERRRAMTAMLGAADNVITAVHLCVAVSKSQILLAVSKQSEKELRQTIGEIFRHFYKIYDVELVEIESKIY